MCLLVLNRSCCNFQATWHRQALWKLLQILCPTSRKKTRIYYTTAIPSLVTMEDLTLSGIRITDEQSALNCINYLHEKYHIPTVIITSTNMALSPVICGYGSRLISLVNNNISNLSDQMNRSLINKDSEYERIRFKIPLVNYNFIGTGDLFAALILARLESKIENEYEEQLPKYSFKDALQSVLSTMQAVILRTLKMSENDLLNVSNTARIELKIIQSIDDIRNPIVGDYVEEM
ncbi:hypothetical protein MN116_008118 [Schistosoma mekongi]|uniref:pyridoxal kinase n=1 Tax=Schistosoma mekongi TaxID=38744 RepID=A0AAE1Z7N4_SCHME|nr:hypothetical protein MN116_008118 [Schistosoma mekongi]